ncbi:DUF4177 domain-containing protein [Calothrix sp. 336/3]|uniref:DUF4177 domain-containing protein n=1 Tax=Calothrix sp. 336/3 TaxID=1337936 RepID=UPI0004E396B4|nr:DUF4177 domain-containing protein [Calothrix sp. 336/3]AKG19993.1 hypothetical protein IJ00_00510 [Calothrix sp. 336/3]
MQEYKFVRVPLNYDQKSTLTSHLEISVNEHAQEGWRLVQILVENPAAVPFEYVVIFERPRGASVS